MTNPTGSNNLVGLLGGLADVVDTVLGMAEQKLSEFTEGVETDQTEGDGADPVTYKLVSELGLADALVLEDGYSDIRSVSGDAFGLDLVEVTLENGDCYNLLRTSLVRVV